MRTFFEFLKFGNWDGYVRYTLFNYVASEIIIYIVFGAPQEASNITKIADFGIYRDTVAIRFFEDNSKSKGFRA